MSDNIFIERDSNEKQDKSECSISKKDILNTIPKNALDKCNGQLANIMTEWRWRIFQFEKDKETFIEMSFKKPTESRKYINTVGKWVERNVGKEFDSFVIVEKYAYCN